MTFIEDSEETTNEIEVKAAFALQCRECLDAQTSQDLRVLLQLKGMEIDDILAIDGPLTTLEKNRIALIYYSNQKLPFLLGHKVKYAPSNSTAITLYGGIICGVIVVEKDIDPERLWIYNEDLGTIHHVPLENVVFPSRRTSCHPDIKKHLEQFVRSPSYDETLLLVPELPSQRQSDDDDDNPILMNVNPVYTKPKLFSRDDTRTPWYELVDPEQPLCTVVEDLFKLFTTFEDENTILPIVVAASCQPSAISNYSQIGVFFGLSGSGKSSCCHVIEGLYDIPKVLSSITYAGFRNHVDEYRTIASAEYSGERNIHVVIDEISPDTLTNNDFYTLLKGGVSIATSDIRISSERTGENKSFNCFCPKSFSTCNPFWQEQKYNEIRRRIFVFETKKVDNRDFLSKEEINYNECDRKLSKVLENFWVENQGEYKQYVRRLRGDDRDILATIGCLYSVEIPEAKKMLEAFRHVTQSKTYKPDARVAYLESFLSSFAYHAQCKYARAQTYGKIKNPKIYIKIKTSELTHYFKEGANAGIFDRALTGSKEIAALMTAKGYDLQHITEGNSNTGQSWYWIKQFVPEMEVRNNG